jgi:hypothetical protein
MPLEPCQGRAMGRATLAGYATGGNGRDESEDEEARSPGDVTRRGTLAALALIALVLFACGVEPAQPPECRPNGHSACPSPTASPSPSSTPSPPESVPPPPTTYRAGYNPAAGETVVNPVIDCNADPLNNTGGPAGIVVDDPNVTVVNPEIRECGSGIRVQKRNGVMPTNVRVIADASYPGYTATGFTLDRVGIFWAAGNGEVGDVSVPTDSVGGELEFVNNYRAFSGINTTSFRMHHVSTTCTIPCPTYSGADSPGMHWALKFIADRTMGTPFEASHTRFDHNFVQGYADEGISFDSRGNEPDKMLGYAAATVTGKGAGILELAGVPITESTIGMYVTVNEGAAQGRTVRITARSGVAFTVADPSGYIADVTVGTRVTVGGRFHDNLVDHNTIDMFHQTAAKSGINTTSQTFSRYESNYLYDTPDFGYSNLPAFNVDSDHQCIFIRSSTGPNGVPAFSFYNSVVNNTCEDGGDISAVVVSWGTYEVRSPQWIEGNTFLGPLVGQVVRYKSPQPATDPTG